MRLIPYGSVCYRLLHPGMPRADEVDGITGMRRAGGFALLDVIFVCGIIGLLCSIALPRLLLAKQAAG